MTARGLAGFEGRRLDDCDHPLNLVVDHPTRPGKSLCRKCGQVGTIMQQIGPILLPKTGV